MAKQSPNNTSQSGIYYTGGGGYVDVDSTFALASNDYVTFATRAAADSWSDGDLVDILIRKSEGNLFIWTATWDATNEYLLLATEHESLGTISDSDAVEVTAVVRGPSPFRGVRLHHRDNQQTIATATTTELDWDDTDFEEGNWWDSGTPSEVVIPEDGYYEAVFGWMCNTKYTTNEYCSLFIRLNGISIAGHPGYYAGYGPSPINSGPMFLEKDDILKCGVYTSRAGMETHVTDKRLFFTVRKLD